MISKNKKKRVEQRLFFLFLFIFFCVCELWPLKLITAIAAAARECVYCTHTGGENITRNVTIVTKRWSRRFFWKEEKRRKNFVLFSVLCVCCIAFWMCNKNFLFFCCCDPPLLSIWRIGYERDTVGVFLIYNVLELGILLRRKFNFFVRSFVWESDKNKSRSNW